MSLSISAISKQQWVSVVKNVIFAGISAYGAAILVSSTDQRGAILLGIMAGLKVIEKLFTPSVVTPSQPVAPVSNVPTV